MSTTLKDRLETAKVTQEAGLSTAIAKDSVLGWLNSPGTATELARALPSGMEAGRFARIVQTEVRKNPDLLRCTPQSFILAVLNAAQLGLEPGPLGHSFLVPLRNNKTNQLECNLWLGYKGLKELAYRGGTVDFIDAVEVHEGEPFRIVRQPDSHLEHEELPQQADAPIVAYYAFAVLTGNDRVVFEVMWPKDIDGIRKRSRAKDAGPWVSDFPAMALKTVTRRLLNRGKVRLKAEIAEAIHEDEARELGYDKPELLPSLTLEGVADGAGEAGAGTSKEKPAKTPASPASKQEPSEGGQSEQPSDAGGAEAAGASVGNPSAVAMTSARPPMRCEVCGAEEDATGHLKHDDEKHAAVAKAKRDAKKQGESEGLPLDGGS